MRHFLFIFLSIVLLSSCATINTGDKEIILDSGVGLYEVQGEGIKLPAQATDVKQTNGEVRFI